MEAKCVVSCLWQSSTRRTELVFGVTVESITENWRGLCHRAWLFTSTSGGGLVCKFIVVLVAVLKSMKVQGMMLKIKLKDL